MTDKEIEAKIVDILVNEFDVDRSAITPDTDLFAELDLDSIDAIDLVVRLQQQIGKKVDPEDFRSIRTLKDVTAAVSALLRG